MGNRADKYSMGPVTRYLILLMILAVAPGASYAQCPPVEELLYRLVRNAGVEKQSPHFRQLAGAAQQLRNNHHVVIPPTVNPARNIDTSELRSAYDRVFTQTPPRPGTRLFISTPSRPRPDDGINIMRVSQETAGQIDAWADSVLAAAQAAFPDEKLVRGPVSLGRGFNAQNSLIHIDNAGTYMQATSTLQGSSTALLTEGAVENLRRAFPGKTWRLAGKNPDGSYVVEALEGSQPVGRTTLNPGDVIEPQTGSTVLITGRDRVTAVSDSSPTFHSSPLMVTTQDTEDRLTLFVAIRRATD